MKNKNNEKKYEEEIDVRRRKLRGKNMYEKTKKGEEINLIYNLIRKG